MCVGEKEIYNFLKNLFSPLSIIGLLPFSPFTLQVFCVALGLRGWLRGWRRQAHEEGVGEDSR